MKKCSLLFTLLLLVLGTAHAEGGRQSRLETEHYSVSITVHCAEGNVTCDNVTYEGTSKRSGSAIKLNGTTWHTECADGSPCRFLGYRFANGNVHYRVHQDGLLEVVRGESDVLVSETGQWHY
ncbi:hypothetical protein BGP77_02470 [Saccharospirillum sp. MSK14-1]|uniref:hypothetical protein n=1 Tax=Saccharospirillum sp. MSK14-1 TaxID=1897632 RepID=UPI000D4837E0|nr:hypothetical protein [Saccharospirillum sp. MSK14-1]PTY36197.1 hypothetical protein BGP77_02470 [Saccharospirillum sp. MSK14-1]